jgi:hypothetical protein
MPAKSDSQLEIERRRTGTGAITARLVLRPRRPAQTAGARWKSSCLAAWVLSLLLDLSQVSDSPIPPSSSASTRLWACSCGTGSDQPAAIAGPRELETAPARSTRPHGGTRALRSAPPCQSLRRMFGALDWIDLETGGMASPSILTRRAAGSMVAIQTGGVQYFVNAVFGSQWIITMQIRALSKTFKTGRNLRRSRRGCAAAPDGRTPLSALVAHFRRVAGASSLLGSGFGGHGCTGKTSRVLCASPAMRSKGGAATPDASA